jgi:hypothetical protein
MKSWKNLFVKNNEDQEPATPGSGFSFPASTPGNTTPGTVMPNPVGIDPSIVQEVLTVYEKGIDSINMPGYDFYEFYKAISSIPHAGDQAYNMAFQMAKSMDSTVSPQKLQTDAEFYISKINEVHNQYTSQGQQKINALESKKNEQKNKLTAEINQATQQVAQLRNQLMTLETEINQKRTSLTSVDGEYAPQENVIRQKILANDHAKQISISKLTSIKEGIQKFIKN